jgi:hypothetical protein
VYRLQYRGWGNTWCTTRQYKTKRAATINLVKKKFDVPDLEWRVVSASIDLDWDELVEEFISKEQKDGNQI